MPRGRINVFGRTADVKPFTFRASAAERAGVEERARQLGIRPNELARRRAFGYGDTSDGRARSMSTESRRRSGNMSTDSKVQELRVEYDE